MFLLSSFVFFANWENGFCFYYLYLFICMANNHREIEGEGGEDRQHAYPPPGYFLEFFFILIGFLVMI